MQPEFHLTPEEEALVENSGWILAKQRIIGKVYGMFGLLSAYYSETLTHYSEYIPDEVRAVSPKIYKGEMYRQMPYVMLDHPRFFSAEHTFAIRCFFWWGNHFSIHLLLSGKYRERYIDALSNSINMGLLDDWFVGVADEPWDHHFDEENYQPVHFIRNNKQQQIKSGNYLKLAKNHSFDQWNDTYAFYIASYKRLLESMCL